MTTSPNCCDTREASFDFVHLEELSREKKTTTRNYSASERAGLPVIPSNRLKTAAPQFLRMNARSVRRDSIIWQGDVAAAAVFRNTEGTETFLGAKQTPESPWLPEGLLTSGTTGCSLLARAPPSRLWKRRPRVFSSSSSRASRVASGMAPLPFFLWVFMFLGQTRQMATLNSGHPAEC